MGIIKGQNLRLTVGGKFVAFATSCTVHVSANMEETSTKDSTNDFTEQEITGLSWDVSTDALFSVDTDATGINGYDALDLILAKTAVTIEFERAASTNNRSVVTGYKYSGSAYVNDVSVNATNRQNASYSLSATGTGSLTKSSVSGIEASAVAGTEPVG